MAAGWKPVNRPSVLLLILYWLYSASKSGGMVERILLIVRIVTCVCGVCVVGGADFEWGRGWLLAGNC